MTDKHTPGPWHVEQYDEGLALVSQNLNYIADMRLGLGAEDEEKARSDARRIVACVNACEGLASEDLERGMVALTGATDALEKQRDELLATIGMALDQAIADGYGESSVLVTGLRAAIAKSQGR